MKITTLVENELGKRTDLQKEHGISLYIEANGKKILFDTGQCEKFIRNAKKLNIDLKELDYVILTHGHYDHSGGFVNLIKQINPDIELFIGQDFFNKKYNLRYNGEYAYVGNRFDQEFLKDNSIVTNYVDKDLTHITDDILIITNIDRDEEFENINKAMYISKDGGYEKDMFLDEISLAVKTDKGLIVLVGCSHAGIVNILETTRQRTGMNIHAVVGGTHLIREDDEKINKVIDYFKENDIKVIGACHCTGLQGTTMLRQQLEENFIENNTGDILKF